MTVGTIEKVSTEKAADIAFVLTDKTSVDLCHSFLTYGTHPTLGRVVVVNSADGTSAIVYV